MEWEWAAMAYETENIIHIWNLGGLDFKVGDWNGV